jgi:hypothetical protein
MISRATLSGVVAGQQKFRSMLAGNAAFIPTAFNSIATANPAGTSTFTFSSIPSTYQHLQIRFWNLTSANGESVLMRFNGDTGGNYTRHRLRGYSSVASSSGSNGNTSMYVNSSGNGSSTTYPEFGIIDIHDYANTSKYKSMKDLNGVDVSGSGDVSFQSGLWMSTSAINSITFLVTAGTFSTGTIFALYGIAGA